MYAIRSYYEMRAIGRADLAQLAAGPRHDVGNTEGAADLDQLAARDRHFQTIIGIVAIVVGVLYFSLIQGTVAIAAGLILAMGILSSIPALGKYLVQLAKWLGSFQTIIGVIAIIFGILGLLRII